MRFLKGLIVGIVIGGAAYWFLETRARQHPEAEQRYEQSVGQAGAAAQQAAHNFSDALKAKLDTLDLRADQIKSDMERTGKVVRRKAEEFAGQAADAASDARIVAEIKAKFAADPNLSVWSISVSCHQGHVALSGAVSTPEAVGQAVALALEPSGVQDATSTLEIKPK